ncbi:type II secretion system protein [Pseudaquabacterium pictum]|uniref:Type II secretion system pseudopilin TklG n=1 Tax=Pseudaquabacterium pictum TaxID=2315236 RepID=A0A480APV3_9BURK|nr:type II secretion system protein [Rubrivivax pictus]GCL63461.1 hypothetical protein AQPW35_25420 [Rubrivivax pictus]
MPRPHAERGAALLAVLLAVLLLGMLQHAALSTAAVDRQREREAELLFIGAQFERAIASYVQASPRGAAQWPRDFDDLLADRRFPQPVAHLRRLWRDPFTGAADWVPIRVGNTLVGVHSRAQVVPLRTQGFGAGQGAFAAARSVADWRFVHTGVAAPLALPAPVTPAAPGLR